MDSRLAAPRGPAGYLPPDSPIALSMALLRGMAAQVLACLDAGDQADSPSATSGLKPWAPASLVHEMAMLHAVEVARDLAAHKAPADVLPGARAVVALLQQLAESAR